MDSSKTFELSHTLSTDKQRKKLLKSIATKTSYDWLDLSSFEVAPFFFSSYPLSTYLGFW